MVWQDYVMSACAVGFLVSLIPQVIRCFTHGTESISLICTGMTSVLLAVMVFTFFSLRLYLTASVNLLTDACWIVMFIKRVADGRQHGAGMDR
jgi:hypothetical protein